MSRPNMMRQASGNVVRNCFCFEKVENQVGHLRLECNCLVHYHCLVQYIRSKLTEQESTDQCGIACPYAYTGECQYKPKLMGGGGGGGAGSMNALPAVPEEGEDEDCVDSSDVNLTMNASETITSLSASARSNKSSSRYYLTIEDLYHLEAYAVNNELRSDECENLTSSEIENFTRWCNERNAPMNADAEAGTHNALNLNNFDL